MSAVLISYDLGTPGQKYADLHKEIKNIGTWWHYLDSTWIVAGSGLTAQNVAAKVNKHLDGSDALVCFDITGDSYQGCLTEDAWAWIQKHV